MVSGIIGSITLNNSFNVISFLHKIQIRNFILKNDPYYRVPIAPFFFKIKTRNEGLQHIIGLRSFQQIDYGGDG